MFQQNLVFIGEQTKLLLEREVVEYESYKIEVVAKYCCRILLKSQEFTV